MSRWNKKEISMLAEFSKALDIALNGINTKSKIAMPLSKAQVIETILGRISPDEMLDAVVSAQAEAEKEQVLPEAA